MDFVVSMTHRAPELHEMLRLWQEHGDVRDPFTRTIFTPLFAQSGVMNLMRNKFKKRGGVIFDSGGYYVQQEAITYEALHQRLLTFYKNNPWASWYVLPDYVPTSSLSPAEVESRVNATVTVSKIFFDEMPAELRPYALPVVQGHTLEQIQYCVESYADLGVTYIGFGSFGTSGVNNSINRVTVQSVEMIEFLKHLADRHNLKIHLFGVGTPNVLPLFYDLEVDSFDSSCWSRTAGYGNVYLPFRGRRNISNRMVREIGGQAYTRAEFAELKDTTGHDCPFCEDIAELETNRIYQMLHNLYVMLDTMDALHRGEKLVPEVIGLQASKYKQMRTKRTFRPLRLKDDHE